MNPQKITKKEIKAWCVFDPELDTLSVLWDEEFSAWPSAIFSNKPEASAVQKTYSKRGQELNVISCTIVVHLPKKPTKKHG